MKLRISSLRRNIFTILLGTFLCYKIVELSSRKGVLMCIFRNPKYFETENGMLEIFPHWLHKTYFWN